MTACSRAGKGTKCTAIPRGEPSGDDAAGGMNEFNEERVREMPSNISGRTKRFKTHRARLDGIEVEIAEYGFRMRDSCP